jgi:hypothetical protein
MLGLFKQGTKTNDETNTFIDASSEDIWAAFEATELVAA